MTGRHSSGGSGVFTDRQLTCCDAAMSVKQVHRVWGTSREGFILPGGDMGTSQGRDRSAEPRQLLPGGSGEECYSELGVVKYTAVFRMLNGGGGEQQIKREDRPRGTQRNLSVRRRSFAKVISAKGARKRKNKKVF